nr:hypothetical protein [Tanacetum cinerariifolium]
MTHHHGTVAAAEGSVRGSIQGSEKSVRGQYEVQGGQKNQYEVQKKAVRGTVAVRGSKKKSILEGDVAQCDWWIKNISAAMKNDQNTLRSRSLIGWSIELTKMPPAPHLGYKYHSHSQYVKVV